MANEAQSPDARLADVVQRNIEALVSMQKREEEARSPSDRVADALTHFSGSMVFVYLHLLWFIAWFSINLGLTPLKPIDEYPFGLLTLVVSLESIFLSTFLLISQNRQALLSDRRADLDVQIDLLAEHEITRILSIVSAVAAKLEVQLPETEEVRELEKDTEPSALLEALKQNGSK